MTYLLAKYVFVFILATIAGSIFGRWMTRRNLVDVTESFEDLRIASNEPDAAQWERLWRRFDSIPEPKEVNLNGVNERLDTFAYAITNLAARTVPRPTVDLNPIDRRPRAVESAVAPGFLRRIASAVYQVQPGNRRRCG